MAIAAALMDFNWSSQCWVLTMIHIHPSDQDQAVEDVMAGNVSVYNHDTCAFLDSPISRWSTNLCILIVWAALTCLPDDDRDACEEELCPVNCTQHVGGRVCSCAQTTPRTRLYQLLFLAIPIIRTHRKLSCLLAFIDEMMTRLKSQFEINDVMHVWWLMLL